MQSPKSADRVLTKSEERTGKKRDIERGKGIFALL